MPVIKDANDPVGGKLDVDINNQANKEIEDEDDINPMCKKRRVVVVSDSITYVRRDIAKNLSLSPPSLALSTQLTLSSSSSSTAWLSCDNVTDTRYPRTSLKRKYNEPYTKNAKRLTTSISETNMLNSYRNTENGSSIGGGGGSQQQQSDNISIATLSNMGNTCYLNSILYTLRFAPSFLHNLHHLVADVALVHARLNQTKVKSSSLGRNISSFTSSSNRSSSSKDLLALGNSAQQNDVLHSHPKTKMQIATEKLHELYTSLHSIEVKENHANDSYQPMSFLQALVDVNSIYQDTVRLKKKLLLCRQGHQQQDAHELFVHLLDILRETCDMVAKQAENLSIFQTEFQQQTTLSNTNTCASTNLTSKYWGVRRSWKKQKDQTPVAQPLKKSSVINASTKKEETNEEDQLTSESVIDWVKKIGYNFILEDFGGVTLRRTKCLECESISERKEPFYDIYVPIPQTEIECDDSDLYRRSCVTTENLRDTNKYWCENCVRYNEARREVSYERLPNLLVLQLKRFSTTVSGTEKMNNYMPTPLRLECFCEQCSHLSRGSKLHLYQLYAVIMHLGSSMASGHYITYTRVTDHQNEYMDCSRENSCLSSSSSSSSTSSNGSEKSINFRRLLKFKSLNMNNGDSVTGASKNGPLNGVHSCKGLECCGIKLSKSVVNNGDDLWLEFDDNEVRAMSTAKFQKILSSKRDSFDTPYLLFYSKIKEQG